MECFVCNQDAEQVDAAGDYQDISCDECGRYRITGTVVHMWESARWINTKAMQHWIAEQQRGGVEVPTINSQVVIWDGVRIGF